MRFRKGRLGRHMGTAASLLAMLFVSVPVYAESESPLEERLELCAGCHNKDGNSLIPENPKLSGLHPKYLQRQLEHFRSGERKHPIMGNIAQMLDSSELKPLAEYFSKQKRLPGLLAPVEPGEAGAAAAPNEQVQAELVAKGGEIFNEGVLGSGVPACMGCHGEDGSGNDKFPRIGGQNNVYLVNQLQNFKSGARDNDPKGVMRAVAQRLTDEEIKAVAEYVLTLKEEDEEEEEE